MNAIHRFTHDTLSLSSSFLLALIALSVAVTAAGLLAPRIKRISAANRHFVLSLSMLLPLIAGFLVAMDVVGAIQRFVTPPSSTPVVQVMSLAELSSVRPVDAASEGACILLLFWAAGTVAFLIASTRTWLRWRRAAIDAVDISNENVLAVFRDAHRDGKQAPRIAVSPVALEPMVVGLIHPSILLPAGYAEGLSIEELTAVFAHELEHVRRRDNITAALHELVCALFWFDPTKWIARQRLLDLRERACDERVLDLGCEPDPYLTALARSCHAAIESPVVACMSGFHVKERMESIMNYRSLRARFLSTSLVKAGTAFVAIALAITFAMVSPRPAIASQASAGGDYNLEVLVRPTRSGRLLVDVTVFSPSGERVMGSQTTADAGIPLLTTASQGTRSFEVRVVPSATETSPATLNVSENDRIVFTLTKNVPAAVSSVPASKAEPIDLSLKDAELDDVLRLFSQLTGRRIVADPGINGKVTIQVADTPWDEALLQTIWPLGLMAIDSGDEIRIVRASTAPAVGAPSNSYVPVTEGMTRPVILTRVEPAYTPEAKEARIAGMVIVQAFIDETGVVRETRILKSLPFGLGEAAADAVRQWTFSPAQVDGKPVPVSFNITVAFRPDGA